MPKRTNEESRSEPAAKRVANSPHEDLLVEAQASLDRLDFKTTETICSQIIDSNPKDVHHPLMMRSISLGKTNRPYEAVQDVERALNSKKSVETHLRAAFAYLGMVQHHLNLAKGHFAENEDPTTSLISHNVIELEESIQEAKDLEKRGSFKRVSPELFVKIVGFCDSPSLMRCARVSKQFKQSILGEDELFRSFTMTGTIWQILQGMSYFSKRCNDSIHSVNLEVLDVESLHSFRPALSRSALTLRSIEVAHQGDMGYGLFYNAHGCPLLKVFSSSRIDSSNNFHRPASDDLTSATNLAIWKPQQLETFIFICGSSNLHFDDALSSILVRAKVVKISDPRIHQHWVLRLLSSNQSLITVEIPLQVKFSEEDESMEMPTFNLPSLTSLNLATLPMEGFNEDGSTFLNNLAAPSLRSLSIGEVEFIDDLAFLKSNHLHSLSIGITNISEYGSGEVAASSLLKSIQGFAELQDLSIKAEGLSSADLCDSLVSFLTPQSKENIRSSWKDQLLLPELVHFSLRGREEDQVRVDMINLASMVASRRALHQWLPSEIVLRCANGDFTLCETSTSSPRNVAFKPGTPQICSQIDWVDIKDTFNSYYPSEPNKTAANWLIKNLSRFSHPYLASDRKQ